MVVGSSARLLIRVLCTNIGKALVQEFLQNKDKIIASKSKPTNRDSGEFDDA